MVLSTALFDKPAFKNLVCNGLVLAADGKKMSKRLKNYPVRQSNTAQQLLVHLCLLSRWWCAHTFCALMFDVVFFCGVTCIVKKTSRE